MRERRRLERRSSGLGGKGTLLAVLFVLVIGAVGGIASNDETNEVKDSKQEVKAEDKKSELSPTSRLKTNVKVQSPSNIVDPEKVQTALDTGPGSLQKIVESTDQFIDELVAKQEAVRKAKNLPIEDFQKTITKDVVEQIDDQITSLNEASQIAHTMALGLLLNQEKGAAFENTENLVYKNLEQLSQNLNSMAYSFETYAMAKSFESWEEAASYLPNRREKALLAIPLDEAITRSIETSETTSNDEEIYDMQTLLTSIYNISQGMDQLSFKIEDLRSSISVEGEVVSAPTSSSLFELKSMMEANSKELLKMQQSNAPDNITQTTATLSANQTEMNQTYDLIQKQFQSIDQNNYVDAEQLASDIRKNFSTLEHLTKVNISSYTEFMMEHAGEEGS
ncbi:hypothetical protein ACWS7L_08295 [Exiguobacterium artemiae]